MIVYDIFVFILGLLIGSFLNVCIYRIPRGESIVVPPSHCTQCGTRLGRRELIPLLSYLLARGKCRHCNEPISKRYLMIELITGLVFVFLLQRYGWTVDFFVFAFMMSLLLVVFMIDLDHKIIPNGLVITGLIGAIPVVIYHAISPLGIYRDERWWSPILGVFPGSGLLFLVALIAFLIYKSDDAMGMGDVKILAPIGLLIGWRLCAFVLLLSILLAGFTSIFLMLTRIKKRKDTIAFGPFIVTASWIAVMWGWNILDWYFEKYF